MGEIRESELHPELTQKFEDFDQQLEHFININAYVHLVPTRNALSREAWDWTEAILTALTNHKHVVFNNETYRMHKRLTTNGHILDGVTTSETFSNNGTKILFSNVTNVESCIHNEGAASQYDNIAFEHDIWTGNEGRLHGLTATRKITANNCRFNAFPGCGVLLYRKAITPVDLTAYNSQFNNCTMEYNKEHGMLFANGANSMMVINPQARFNGTTVYKTAPSTLGQYDGICLDGKVADLPAGENFEPANVLIMQGDISYNSRHGVNFKYSNDCTMVGGYLELNKSNDLAVQSSYGTVILNPMSITNAPLMTTALIDSSTSSRNLIDYPNNIIVRGKNYGSGRLSHNSKLYNMFITQQLVNGSIFTADAQEYNFVFDRLWDGTGNGQSFVKLLERVHLSARNAYFGSDTPAPDKGVWFAPRSDDEGSGIATFLNGTNIANAKWSRFSKASGTAPSAQASALSLPANSTTTRSINAGGTINASGADYAEYMYKSDDCGDISKGAIVGIDSEGKLTDKWSDAISFAVKSTNPSYVGADTWAKYLVEPKEPTKSDESDEDHELLLQEYEEDYAEFLRLLEVERVKVDRIAFSGVCPVNIYDANVGDYIVPVDEDNTIGAVAVSDDDITFAQYKKAVGKVIAIEDDGRALIIVKVI